MVQTKYKKELKHDRKQRRGFLPAAIPLAAIGTAAAASLASKIVGDLYEYVKKRITGKGYKVPNHKTKKEKKQFLLEIVQNI